MEDRRISKQTGPKLIHSSMSSRSKFGLGFGETFGSDEVFDPSAPSIFDTTPEDVAEKPLYDSDKSSDSETTGFASCVLSVKSSSSKTNEPLASAPRIDQIVLLEVGIDQHFSASSWNRPNLVPASSRKGCWELLLSHRRLFLENKGQICNGDPRQSMDLINQHGLNSLKIIHNAGPSLEIIHKNGDLGILDSGNVSRADRLIRRNWMGLCEDCRGELQNIKLVLCFNKFVIQKQVLFMLKCVLFSLRSSNYLRIVRWFSEFQEGNNLYCFNLSDIKLEEMSPVCWPIASLVSLP
ncbi:hypothetical protein Tco_0740018 [Tanacetum coccineum]